MVLLDIHMGDSERISPEQVGKNLANCSQTVALMSFAVDDESQVFAKRFGAHRFLDKSNLYSELRGVLRELSV